MCPLADPVAVVGRRAEHVADHLDRQLEREGGNQVDLARIGDVIEVAIDQLRDARLERGQRLAAERRLEQLANARVVGRVAEHQARRVVLVKRRVAESWLELDLLAGTPAFGIAIDRDHVVVTGQHVAAVGQPVHRIRAPQRGKPGIGVEMEAVGQVEQIEGADVGVWCHGHASGCR